MQRVGSMITLFFRDGPDALLDRREARDTAGVRRFHGGLLRRGIYWPPSQFEAAFISVAHDEAAIDRTVAAAAKVLQTQ